MPSAMIPQQYLYGDPSDQVELDFLHAEPIRLRSGRHDWKIAPHSHPDHTQLLLVQQGGGTIWIDGTTNPITAPALLLIPTGMVHAIHFTPDTDGIVITIAQAYLRRITTEDPDLLSLARRPHCLSFAPEHCAELPLADAFETLLREFVWHAPGRRAAIAAQMLRIMATLARQSAPADTLGLSAQSRRNLDLVQRYRELIEAQFRDDQSVQAYANQLNVTLARLNVACHAVAGKAASKLLFDRTIIEAKRSLLYTGLGVAEIAHTLGFDDPAYFCRFFTRQTGLAPSRFRSATDISRASQPSAAHA